MLFNSFFLQEIAEQQARHNAERQYAERINALATTDPLLRLQMAGINPELPSGAGGSPFGHHPGLSGFMRPPMPGPGGLDPRLRTPGAADLLMRPPPVGYQSSLQHDMLTRHLLMEREQQIAAAAQAQQHHNLMAAAQHEQLVRLDEENRARAAAAQAQQQRN